MPRSQTTGIFTRVSNSFSDPVYGTVIDPTDATSLFDDQDGGMTFNDASPLILIGSTSGVTKIQAADTASGTITIPAGTTDFSATGGTGQVVKQASVGAPFTVGTVPASEIASGAALTKVDDTNVTLALGGTPASALLKAVSLTLGWTGLLGLVRGGTAADLSATGGTGQVLKQSTVGGAVTVGTVPASEIASPAALTKTDDTNVTLTLGGTPATSLLRAVSLTLGWTGLLGVARGGTGLASGTSGGVLGYTASGTLASSAALGANGVVIGGGAGATPTAVTAGTNGQLLLGVTSSAPNMATMSGDATITNAGALTIANNAVTNAKAAQMAAATIKMNATGSTANAADSTIQGLTNLAAPSATLDFVPIYDHVSGTIKNVTPGAIASAGTAGVASLNTKTGALTLSVVIQKFTTSGTYTPTSGMVYAITECVGSGAGGGSAAGSINTNFSGGGGGAGSYSRKVSTAAAIGASQTVTIGAAGSGGSAGSNNGTAGSDVSLGTICIGKGGSGGLFGSVAQVGGGGAGGVAGTGDVTSAGAPGLGGMYANNATTANASGAGGSSIFGGGGLGIITLASAVTGNNGSNYGSGGSGGSVHSAAANAAGGNGSTGIVIVTEFVIA